WETTTLIGGTCKRSDAFSGPVLIARGLDFRTPTCRYGALNVCASLRTFDNCGGHSGGGTPLPIPNREVKPASADGTRGASPRESRSPPNLSRRAPALSAEDRVGAFVVSGGAQLVAPVRVERTQPLHSICDRRMRDEERSHPLLEERVDRVQRLGRRRGLELDELGSLLQPGQ